MIVFGGFVRRISSTSLHLRCRSHRTLVEGELTKTMFTAMVPMTLLSAVASAIQKHRIYEVSLNARLKTCITVTLHYVNEWWVENQ
jgi:hypothetical protein